MYFLLMDIVSYLTSYDVTFFFPPATSRDRHDRRAGGWTGNKHVVNQPHLFSFYPPSPLQHRPGLFIHNRPLCPTEEQRN